MGQNLIQHTPRRGSPLNPQDSLRPVKGHVSVARARARARATERARERESERERGREGERRGERERGREKETLHLKPYKPNKMRDFSRFGDPRTFESVASERGGRKFKDLNGFDRKANARIWS